MAMEFLSSKLFPSFGKIVSKVLRSFPALVQLFILSTESPPIQRQAVNLATDDDFSTVSTNAPGTLDPATLAQEYPQLTGGTYLDYGGSAVRLTLPFFS